MVLTTGDLKNSVARLRALLKATRYPHGQTHANGEFSVADLLRILHHALLDYSRHVAAFLLDKGYDLYGKTDARFIDQCFRLMRDEFQYFPSVNPTQFLSAQFVERKIQLVADILDLVVKKHDECVRRRRQEQTVWSKPRERKTESTHVENHVLPPPAPTPATIDTLSLLEHFREEARARAREEKRAAAQSNEQRRLQHRIDARKSETQRQSHEPSPRRTPSPTNQQASASDATDSNSDTEAEQNHLHAKPLGLSTSSTNAHPNQAVCAYGCGDTKAEVKEVIITLSKQISDLTTAVLTRVSGIETRLSSVEQQLRDLKVMQPPPTSSSTESPPVRDAPPGRRYAPISRTQAAFSATSSTASTDAGGAAAAAAMRSRSAWPPDPELFNLP